MTHPKTIDYLIIGQGLAGSCLAIQLLRRGKKIVVFDFPENNHSSSVAAGLFNPITGKMLAKTWQAEMLFPYFYSFYQEAEALLKKKFFFPMALYRPFASVEEQNEWMGRSTYPSMSEYIEAIHLKSVFGEEVFDPFGGAMLRKAGYVDTTIFIDAVRSLLIQSGSYRREKVNMLHLREESKGVVYGDFLARKVIFCRGVEDLNEGPFSWLPIKPLKGETLTISLSPVSRIYNRGVYIVPTNKEGVYTVGATYDFDLTPKATENGRAELEGRLKELIRIPYTILGQNWGIRPTTPDRRAFLGSHPDHPNHIIFNGFGTKGITLAPYFSGHLASWLDGECEITPGVNIQRYKSLYSRFEA